MPNSHEKKEERKATLWNRVQSRNTVEFLESSAVELRGRVEQHQEGEGVVLQEEFYRDIEERTI